MERREIRGIKKVRGIVGVKKMIEKEKEGI